MINEPTLHLRIDQGDDFRLELDLEDSDGVALDRKGYSIKAEARNPKNEIIISNFASWVTDGSDGRILLYIPRSVTRLLDFDESHHIQWTLVLIGTYWERLLKGDIYLSKGKTEMSTA